MTAHTETDSTGPRRTLLHVTECPSGGVARAVELAIRATPTIEHVVMAPPGAVRTDELGVRFVPLPRGTRARTLAIGRVVHQVGASAVHAHSSRAGGYVRLANVNVPVLYQPHCYAFSDVTKPLAVRCAYWLAERLLTHRTSAVLALTSHEERQARRLGVRRVHRIVNAPTISRSHGSVERSTDTAVKTVAMVGRVVPQKDPSFFAAVAKRFQGDPAIRFIWIGDVPSSGRDSGGAAALERSGVEITGWLDDTELRRQLEEVDLYLHSAVYEGYPLSLLDACELGIPSIARAIPSLADCGLPTFATPNEAAGLVASLLADDQVLNALSSEAIALSHRMGIDAHDASVADVYASYGLIRTPR